MIKLHSAKPALVISTMLVLGAAYSLNTPAAAQGRVHHTSFRAGDVIPVRLDTTLASDKSRRGDRFTTSVDSDKDGYSYMRGAKIEGVVREASPRRGDHPGMLDLSFTRLRTRDGKTYPLSGSIIGLENGEVEHRDGILVAKTTDKKKHLEYAGIGAGVGALANLLGGGKLKLENVLLGGALGAGAAQVTGGSKQIHDVNLKEGTKMGVRLDRPFNYQNY